MAEPKVRFKWDDGSNYPNWNIRKMGSLTNEYKVRNKSKLPLDIYSVNNEVGFLPQSEQFEDAGYLNDTDTSIYMIVPPNHFAYNPARINIGSIGYQNVGHDVQVSSLYEVFKTTKEIDDSFLWYWFHTPIFNKAVLSLQEGGVRLYYYYEKLKETSIALPCLEEQQKIADFLSSVDKVITASEEEVANLETQKKAVMKKIFSQEVRFKRADGSDFPEWEEKPFYDCVDISANMVQPDVELYGDMPHIGPGNIEKGTGHLTEYKLVKDEDLISGKYLFSETDVIYGKINPQLMKVAYPRFKGLCSADAYPLSVHPDVMLPEFLLYSLLESRFVKYSISVSMRTGMPKINRDELGYFKFRIPSLEEQHLIADFLSDFDEAIAAAKKELELWKELKKGLLQQMFV